MYAAYDSTSLREATLARAGRWATGGLVATMGRWVAMPDWRSGVPDWTAGDCDWPAGCYWPRCRCLGS